MRMTVTLILLPLGLLLALEAEREQTPPPHGPALAAAQWSAAQRNACAAPCPILEAVLRD